MGGMERQQLRADRQTHWLFRRLPFLMWLRTYHRGDFAS